MVSSLRRARRTTSSYACQNCRKSICSQPLMDGTTRLREPSGLTRSIAMPRLTCSGRTIAGLPSADVLVASTASALQILSSARNTSCLISIFSKTASTTMSARNNFV